MDRQCPRAGRSVDGPSRPLRTSNSGSRLGERRMAESHHENSDVLADGSLTEHQGVPIIRPEHETRVLVGTCNWSDHESFYPRGLKPGDRLAFYADRFTIVEVDSTYYHLQPPTYFARW